MKDLCLRMNDEAAANTIIKWYEGTTGKKAKKQESKYIKCKYLLDNARKDKVFGDDWAMILSDKLLEIGYEMKQANCNGAIGVASYISIFYQKIVK